MLLRFLVFLLRFGEGYLLVGNCRSFGESIIRFCCFFYGDLIIKEVALGKLALHECLKVLAVDLLVFHQILGYEMQLVDVLSEYRLSLLKGILNDRADLVVDLGCNVLGVAGSAAVISAEEYLVLASAVNNSME